MCTQLFHGCKSRCRSSNTAAAVAEAEAGSGGWRLREPCFGSQNRAMRNNALSSLATNLLVTRFGCEESVQARHLNNHLEAGAWGPEDGDVCILIDFFVRVSVPLRLCWSTLLLRLR